MELSDITYYIIEGTENITLPCRGCTACCKGSAVLTEDEVKRFETFTHSDGRIGTAIDDSNWCIYCIQGVGCSLPYEDKPEVCKKYTCLTDISNLNISKTVRDAAEDTLAYFLLLDVQYISLITKE